MDSTALLTVVGGLLVLSMIVLTGLCLSCKGSSRPTQITENYQHENPTIAGPGFTIVRAYKETTCSNTLSPVSQPLFITPPSVHDQRRPSPCPSPDGSQSDYVNEEDENGYEQPPENDKNDYLYVLPDEPHVSLSSVASSANSEQNYENVHDKCRSDEDSDSQEYINVKNDKIIHSSISPTPIGSVGSRSSDGQDSSDYVNAPKQVNTYLA